MAEGEDLTIVVIGSLLKKVLEARQHLMNVGISAEILYYPTIKPFDREAVRESVAKTGRVLVIEEASAHDGIFNSVLRATCELPQVKYAQIAIEDFIHQYGSYEELCEALGFSVAGILRAVDHLEVVRAYK